MKNEILLLHVGSEDSPNLKLLVVFLEIVQKKKIIDKFQVMTVVEAAEKINGDRIDAKIIFLAERNFSEILEIAKKYVSFADVTIFSSVVFLREEREAKEIGAKFVTSVGYNDLMSMVQ